MSYRVESNTIEYWKAVDWFKEHHLAGDQIRPPEAGYQVHYEPNPGVYQVGAIWFDGKEWHTQTAALSDGIEGLTYYRLTGDLTILDYNEETTEHVDMLVLVRSEEEVWPKLKKYGYWPDYAETLDGGIHFRWVTGPTVEVADDNEVLTDKILPLLGLFSIQFNLDKIEVKSGGSMNIALIIDDEDGKEVVQESSFEASEEITFTLRLSQPLQIDQDNIISMEFYNV